MDFNRGLTIRRRRKDFGFACRNSGIALNNFGKNFS
jgi:hypothetical protein